MRHTRRQFLHHVSAAGTGLVTGASLAVPLSSALAAAPAPARVAMVRRPGVLKKAGVVRAKEVEKMVLEAVASATGLEHPADAFASLFRPDDVVGIKVNCLAGKRMSTRPEVAWGLVAGLGLAGLKPQNIVIWERSSRELERAGYSVQRDHTELRVMGTDGDYEREPIDARSVGGCPTRIVTRVCTKQINAPVLKDHDLAGVSLGMKNWYGAIHNPNKYHLDNCFPYVADLSAHDLFRQRTALVVCDALFAQCHGGPAYVPEFAQRYEAVLASTDPVALDAVGARIIEKLRAKRGLPSLLEASRPPRWIARADQLGLGQADLGAIKVVEA